MGAMVPGVRSSTAQLEVEVKVESEFRPKDAFFNSCSELLVNTSAAKVNSPKPKWHLISVVKAIVASRERQIRRQTCLSYFLPRSESEGQR